MEYTWKTWKIAKWTRNLVIKIMENGMNQTGQNYVGTRHCLSD